MAKMTVLEMVQSILGSMDSDAVLTIGESNESEQTALIVKETYYDLATDLDLPQWNKLSQLQGLGDTTRPTVMKLPETYTDIESIRYKRVVELEANRLGFSDPIRYVDPDVFLNTQLQLDETETNVGMNQMGSDVLIPYRNDRSAYCWTTFDDDLVVFDAYDSSFEATMHNDNSLVLVRQVPEFQMQDDFIPDLPDKAFPAYLALCKEVAHGEQKQINNKIQARRGQRGKYRNRVQTGINDGRDQGLGQEGQGREGGHGRQYRGRYRQGNINRGRRY